MSLILTVRFLLFFLYAILAKDFNSLLNVSDGIIDQRLLTITNKSVYVQPPKYP